MGENRFAVDSSFSVGKRSPFQYTLLFYTLLPTLLISKEQSNFHKQHSFMASSPALSMRAPPSCRPSRRALTSASAAPPGDVSPIINRYISYLDVATNQKRPNLFVFDRYSQFNNGISAPPSGFAIAPRHMTSLRVRQHRRFVSRNSIRHPKTKSLASHIRSIH